jgi:hypothetical protein
MNGSPMVLFASEGGKELLFLAKLGEWAVWNVCGYKKSPDSTPDSYILII